MGNCRGHADYQATTIVPPATSSTLQHLPQVVTYTSPTNMPVTPTLHRRHATYADAPPPDLVEKGEEEQSRPLNVPDYPTCSTAP
jgi:hypothetical protein